MRRRSLNSPLPSPAPGRAGLRVVRALLVFALLSGTPGAAGADPQDLRWSSDFAAPGINADPTGGDRALRTSVNWNGLLVIGGDLTHAGGMPARNVATWNGSTFATLGDGLNGTVRSLAVVAGTLYAAGDFTASGSTPLPNVARWSGTGWVAVGTGGPDDPTELTLVADGTDLLLLGQFTSVGAPPVAAQGVARWSGGAWSAVGAFAPPAAGIVRAAARVGSTLYVGGRLDDGDASHLNAWDGATWSYDVAGLDGEVNLLAAVGTDLYVQGEFSTADEGNVEVSFLGRWDGSTFAPLTNDTPGIIGMGTEGGELHVVGNFINHPGPYSASWSGTNWNAGPARIWTEFAPSMTTFTRIGGDLFYIGNIGGYYDDSDGGVIKGARGIVAWNGTDFRALGPGFGLPEARRVYALTAHGGRLYAGGDFNLIGRLGDARGLAAWDGTAWTRLGTGLNQTSGNPSCDQLTTWNGRVVASGYFTGGGSVTSRNVIAWNGTGWEGLNGGFAGQGARLADWNGELIAAGLLQTEMGSGSPLGHVARWTGTQWVTIGTVAPAAGASATRVVSWNGTVIAAGLFSSVSSVGALNIASWNGTAWAPLGAGLNGLVTALGVHAGDLYASGTFTASGVTPLPGFMARWSGGAWHAVGTGLDAPAEALSSAGADLYATGTFGLAGGGPAPRIAAWSGTAWRALGSGLGQGYGGNGAGGLCLATHDGGLFVGGGFTTAGVYAASALARWDYGAVTAVAPVVPERGFQLSHPRENPAPGRAEFALRLDEPGPVDAAVFDARGRRIRTLLTRHLGTGEQILRWDGTDDAGHRAVAGIYWVRVVGTRGAERRKLILVP